MPAAVDFSTLSMKYDPAQEGRCREASIPVAAPELGATAIRTAVERAKSQPEQVEKAVMGCALSGC